MLKNTTDRCKFCSEFCWLVIGALIFHQDQVLSSFICYEQLDVLTCDYCLVLQLFERIKRIQLEKYHKSTDPTEKAAIEVDPLKIFHSAIENCKPLLQLNSVKRGGQRYQVK